MLARVVQKPSAVSHLRYRIADFQGSIGKELAGNDLPHRDTHTVHVNASRLTKCKCIALTISLQARWGLQLVAIKPLCNWHKKSYRPCSLLYMLPCAL